MKRLHSLRARLWRPEIIDNPRLHTLRFWFTRNAYFDFARRMKFYEVMLDASEAGISIIERLRQMYARADQHNRPQRALYAVILERMDEGLPFSRALAGLAPLGERMLIAAGEERNNIGQALKNLLWLMERTEQTRNKLASSGLNILLQLSILAGMLWFITAYIGPDVRKTLDPDSWTPTTHQFFAFSDFLSSGGWLSLALPLALLAVFWRKTPLFYLYRLGQSAYLLTSLHSLVGAGVSLHESLNQIARNTRGYLRDQILAMMERLSSGATEGEALDTGLLPRDIAEDLADYGSARGFAQAMESMGRQAHKRFMRALDVAATAVDVAVKLGIAGYLFWFLSAIGTAAMGAFSTIRF